MAAEIINLPIGNQRNWMHIRPVAYKIAFEQSQSKDVADHVMVRLEECYYRCVPDKYQRPMEALDNQVSEFDNHIHKVVGSFICELTIILTDGFILAARMAESDISI